MTYRFAMNRRLMTKAHVSCGLTVCLPGTANMHSHPQMLSAPPRWSVRWANATDNRQATRSPNLRAGPVGFLLPAVVLLCHRPSDCLTKHGCNVQCLDCFAIYSMSRHGVVQPAGPSRGVCHARLSGLVLHTPPLPPDAVFQDCPRRSRMYVHMYDTAI